MLRDHDEEEEAMPFEGLEKSTVVQECKAFHASGQNVSLCKTILLKLMYLFAHGESVAGPEATDLFFGATKLFESSDPTLRRLLYICLKELAKHVDIALVAVNALLKDVNSSDDMYRANAIRALRHVADAATMGQTADRYLKQAVQDRCDQVSSSALVTGVHLAAQAPDMVKRWGEEVNESLKQKGTMAQYHALALLHKIRRNDKLSVSKLVASVSSIPIRNPMALCLLIRMCADVLKDDYEGSPTLSQFVLNQLKHANEMVVFEAAKCLCTLKNVPQRDVSPAVLVLQLYLTSHKPVLRYASVRLLNQVAGTHPSCVQATSIDMESLVSDSNRNIATLAITTLLKAGSEYVVDRLMQNVSSFIGEIADDFKIVVIDSMKHLCQKFPNKYADVLAFLSEALREEGGYEYKKTIVDVIVSIIESTPEAAEDGLLHLCELIEDCEFIHLSQRVLHYLGQKAPHTRNPNRYIRYIFNRTMLEMPVVRAAAVSALAKFAAYSEPLRQNILVLLSRVAQDTDDEVRDRALVFCQILEKDDDINLFIANPANLASQQRSSWSGVQTIRSGTSTEAAAATEKRTEVAAEGPAASNAASTEQRTLALRDLNNVPKLKGLGTPHHTSEPVPLTDADTEYVVNVFKHSYPEHVILQYRIVNSLDNAVMDDINVQLTAEIEGLEVVESYPIKRLNPRASSSVFVLLTKDAESYPTGDTGNVLVFTMKEIEDDGTEGEGDEAEYQLEDFGIGVADYMQPYDIINFQKEWDEIGELEQSSESFALQSMKTLQAASDELTNVIGMTPINNTNKVPEKAKQHIITYAGRICAAEPVKMLVKARVFYSTDNVVTLDFAVRGGDENTRAVVCSCLS